MARKNTKILTIRNVSDKLYKTISRLAQREGRSIQQQSLKLLEVAESVDKPDPIEKASRIRAKLANRKLGNLVSEIKEDRRR